MAYTQAQAKQVDKSRAVIVFTGNSGEETVVLEMPIGTDKGVWVNERLAELNAKQTVITAKPVQEGEIIAPTVPAPAPLTPLQQWQKDRDQVLRDKQDIDAGLYNANDADAKAHNDAAKASRAAYLASLKG